jgi:hypothetical protein
MFPSYMLEKVYVRGSLKSTEAGFSFTLKNVVEAATLGSIVSLVVDGAEIPLTDVTLVTPQGERKVTEITYRNPVPVRYNAEVTVQAAGTTLASGKHNLKIGISVLEAGRIDFKFEDEI